MSSNPADDFHEGRGWLNRAADRLNAWEDALGAAEFARAAATIGAGYIALAHAERAAATSATLDAAAERVRRAAAEARPHDDEHALNPRTGKDCSGGAFLRLECDLQLDGASVLSLHKVGSDVHLRVWHAGSDQYAVAVLDRAYRRDVVHALTEFDTSEADRG